MAKLPIASDSDIPSFGQYNKSKTSLANIPASYLLWLLDETDLRERTKLGNYIIANEEAIRNEAKIDKKQKNK